MLRNSSTGYGLVAIVLHWAIAVLFLGQIVLGLVMARGRTHPESFSAELVDTGSRDISFHVVGDIFRSPYGMDAGTPLYSNKVSFDMTLNGTRR